MATRQQTLFTLMLVALAMATSTFTVLRFGELAIGVPELILLGCMIAHVPLGGNLHAGGNSRRFMIALALLYVAILPGFFVTLVSQGLLEDVMHNLLALSWIVVLFAYLQFGFDYQRDELEWLCGLVLAFSGLYFAVCLGLALFVPETVYMTEELVELDVGGAASAAELVPRQRLHGLAANPNQFGLHAIVALFFCLCFWSRVGTIKSIILMGVILTAGFLTGSDAFILGAILMIGATVVLGLLLSGSIYKLLILFVPLVIGSLVVYRPILREVRALTEANDQDQTRFTLWENGWLAVMESPVFGWGPGSWSGFNGPLELFESHNSLIDYVASSGLVGGVIVTACLLGIGLAVLRSGRATFMAGLAGILFFAMFHNTLRQPLMWLAFFYIAHHVWEDRSSQPNHASGRRRRRQRRSSRSRAAA